VSFERGAQMSDAVVISSIADAVRQVGMPLGSSNWRLVDQPSINAFGDITGDQQWLHTDPEKASQGPFGGCVAHGLYTLGLAGGVFFHDIVRTHARVGLNYGCNRVRYPSPLLVGSRVRGHAVLKAAEPMADEGVQLLVEITVEIENMAKPACVAEFVVRYYF